MKKKTVTVEGVEGAGIATPANAEDCAPKALSFFNKGIRTGEDFANGMSALMSDLAAGRITPQVGNAICNAGGKLLKIVDMQYRYGTKSGESGKTLQLASGKADD